MTILKTLFENIAQDANVMNMYFKNQSQSENEENTHIEIARFFTEHPSPTDEEVHQFAEETQLTPAEFEEQTYRLLHALLKGVGKHNAVPDSDFDSEQLQSGIEVELEHTDNMVVAKMIAKDHLSEFPDYYTRLRDMESEADREEKEIDDENKTNTNNDMEFSIGI